MAKVLELQFTTEQGKTASVSIDSPKEPVDMAKVNTAMDRLIAGNIFHTSSGDFISKKGARLVERNVEEYKVN